MNERQPLLASVFYLRLPDYAKKAVVEQARLRTQLGQRLAAALAAFAPEQRLVLEAPDGLILAVLDDPDAALAAAERCLSADDGGLCIGGNHGPVAMMADPAGDQGIVGDGVAAAASAAGFAGPGQLLMTASFRTALAQGHPAQATGLRAAGQFADAALRTHELYQRDAKAPRQRAARLGILTAIGTLALLALGFALRGTLPSLGLLAPRAIVTLDVLPAGEIYLDGQRVGSTPPLTQLELSAGLHQIELRHGVALPHQVELDLQAGAQVRLQHRFAPPARVSFEVNQGAEIFVDGQSRGALPALEQLELRAGTYQLELRHPDFPPHQLQLNLQNGENFVVRHTFAPPAVLVFKVTPAGGTVYVDGEARGNLAQLKQLELKAGLHVIELRHPSYPPARRELNLAAGEQAVLRHQFDAVAPDDYLRKFKKALGLGQ